MGMAIYQGFARGRPTLDARGPVSIYTVAPEIGHGSMVTVERVFSHWGTSRRRAAVGQDSNLPLSTFLCLGEMLVGTLESSAATKKRLTRTLPLPVNAEMVYRGVTGPVSEPKVRIRCGAARGIG